MSRQSIKLSPRPEISTRVEPLNEQVYQSIKWSLIVGDYTPDDAISIRSVAAELGMSMMPVREALKRLVSERALTSSGNRSFRVNQLAPKRVADLFFVRSSLEGIATELATPLLTNGQIQRLEELAAKMDSDINKGNSRDYLSRNYSFHFTIYGAAKNSELVSIIESLWAQTGPFLGAGVRRSGVAPDWRQMHSRIAEAIKVRDGALARSLIETDIGWGTNLFSELDAANEAVDLKSD